MRTGISASAGAKDAGTNINGGAIIENMIFDPLTEQP